MTALIDLLDRQRSWAASSQLQVDARGYVGSHEDNFFRSMSRSTEAAFRDGGGSELLGRKGAPAKICALHSSAALVVNVFDYWSELSLHTLADALGLEGVPASIEFEARFPTGLRGTPPNLDIAMRFEDGRVVGIESKFSEWLTPKPTNKEPFAKYFPEDRQGLWSAVGLPGCQALAQSIRAKTTHFRYLDAPQLLKHALGLATQNPGRFALYYLFYEVAGSEADQHRLELAAFEDAVGAETRFRWTTYQDVYERLASAAEKDDLQYVNYLRDRYFAPQS